MDELTAGQRAWLGAIAKVSPEHFPGVQRAFEAIGVAIPEVDEDTLRRRAAAQLKHAEELEQYLRERKKREAAGV